ncbi:hypothetical protein HHK36_025256 [Tetracentron sinense]|uniref:protein-serine/threonine phosphatase n=1 Tax=Tetracentron sinense TaxID=13715 RepID=A0A834YKS6_TETSI|nr:hypothetical protein HHK36_025256 [Tetracentron sinense]
MSYRAAMRMFPGVLSLVEGPPETPKDTEVVLCPWGRFPTPMKVGETHPQWVYLQNKRRKSPGMDQELTWVSKQDKRGRGKPYPAATLVEVLSLTGAVEHGGVVVVAGKLHIDQGSLCEIYVSGSVAELMHVVGSNRFFCNPQEKETLAWMAKVGSLVEDMEEGEISDSGSVEEISEVEFKQVSGVLKPKGESMVGIGDLFKSKISKRYASGSHNLPWSQMVQNKPLDQIFVWDFGLVEKSKRSSSNILANSREDNKGSLNPSAVVIDDSSDEEIDSRVVDLDGGQEKGELEEGEIDSDLEMVEKPYSELDLKEREFEKRLKLARETLETVNVKDAKKSFHEVCSLLRMSFESLQRMFLEDRIPTMDDLVQKLFTGIEAVNFLFNIMNQNQQEQNGDIIARLLAQVKSQDPALFSPKQMKEIEAMVCSLKSQTVLSSIKSMDKEKDIWISDVTNLNESGKLAENPGHDLSSSKKFLVEPISDQNDSNMGSKASKPGLSFGSKGKGGFVPLLDLHRDHNEDNLPSPTRECPPLLPEQKPRASGDGAVRSDLAATRVLHKTEDITMDPYETDALKAVSTYQQNFGRSLLLLRNRLPSPTPSEECDDGDGDTKVEVSSSSTVGNLVTINPPVPLRFVGSTTPHMDRSSGQGLITAKNAGHVSSGSNPTLRALTKSRDPRLPYFSPNGALDSNQGPLSVEYNALKSELIGGTISSRKHKLIEESVLDGHALKRKRNGLTNYGVARDVPKVLESGGILGDSSTIRPHYTDNRPTENMGTDPRKLENGGIGNGNLNVATAENQQLPITGTGTTVSWPSFLKDIAVDPTILMHLVETGRQKLAVEVQQKSGDPAQNTMHPSNSNAVMGTVPLVNVASSKTSELEQYTAGRPQVPVQRAPMNSQGERGKIHLKPCDPRRILRNNTFQESESLGFEPIKTKGPPPPSIQGSKDILTVRQQGEQAETNSMPSQSTLPPDNAQLVEKLKNIADFFSDSQATNTPTIDPHIVSSLPVPDNKDKAEVKAVPTDSDDQKIGIGLIPDCTADPSQSQNMWGDVEHLFEGYDDQQKAAIQRERARRIEEQNKMFAARKLCLVLDLDHTLLNSAKFVEVDPVHEDILRKKEEQDRENLQRQLFRFPQMGMWTKLRPGIWHFLEKASKLYELHIYTMGNKLYATEMAKVLDPTGVLFAGRVISKGDDVDPFDGDVRLPKSKDLDGVLGMESAVVIIDDSVRVWPHNKLNLIAVERYTYFPFSRRQFGLLGPSLLERDRDERPEDGTLASSLAVIERIHQNFFSHRSLNEVDVRDILASEQKKILAGCRIVFSRVFPVGEANPHLHPLWQTAEQFGAVCTNQLDEQVTHVVANCLGTDKVNWALSTRRCVVYPSWVEASALLYRRANEHDFAIRI